MRLALSVHVALEQRALVRPPRAGLHFIGDAKPIAIVNLRNNAFKLKFIDEDGEISRNDNKTRYISMPFIANKRLLSS